MCTELNYSPYDGEDGGGDIGGLEWEGRRAGGLCLGYSSRKNTPEGNYVNATGVLVELDAPGHFLQVAVAAAKQETKVEKQEIKVGRVRNNLFGQTLEFFGMEGPSVDYNVIYLDEDSAIE